MKLLKVEPELLPEMTYFELVDIFVRWSTSDELIQFGAQAGETSEAVAKMSDSADKIISTLIVEICRLRHHLGLPIELQEDDVQKLQQSVKQDMDLAFLAVKAPAGND